MILTYKKIIKSFPVCLCLLFITAIPALASPGEEMPSRMTELARRKEQVNKEISTLKGKIALSRSFGEFIEEVELFDNRIYGKAASHGAEEKVTRLETEIANKNARLEWLLNNYTPPVSEFGQNGQRDNKEEPLLGDPYILEVDKLENEISSLEAELVSTNAGMSYDCSTELMDGSLWQGDEERLQGLNAGMSYQERLESFKELLKKLEKEEKALNNEVMKEKAKDKNKTEDKKRP